MDCSPTLVRRIGLGSQDKRTSIFSKFKDIVLSYEIGCMKPAELIYRVCEQRAGVAPNKIAFIDDKEPNVEAAAGRGWQTHLYKNADDALVWLKQISA